jgi:nitrite reductase/ring-hydroxylating ferredoxin subunit
MNKCKLEWFRVAGVDELPEGRVKTVTPRSRSICLSHFEGRWAAMDNRCPHQGGPLGEGSIEKGVDGRCWIRCPWHGWDFDPLTGRAPGGLDALEAALASALAFKGPSLVEVITDPELV